MPNHFKSITSLKLVKKIRPDMLDYMKHKVYGNIWQYFNSAVVLIKVRSVSWSPVQLMPSFYFEGQKEVLLEFFYCVEHLITEILKKPHPLFLKSLLASTKQSLLNSINTVNWIRKLDSVSDTGNGIHDDHVEEYRLCTSCVYSTLKLSHPMVTKKKLPSLKNASMWCINTKMANC